MLLPRFYYDGLAPASDLPGCRATGMVIPSRGCGRKGCGLRRLPP